MRRVVRRCKHCNSTIEKQIDRRNLCPECAKKMRWKLKLKHRYQLTPDDYDRLIRKQRGRCALCKKPQKYFHVDHCHTTNKVRGLLCVSCNTALGKFEDDPKRLRAAIRYLKK